MSSRLTDWTCPQCRHSVAAGAVHICGLRTADDQPNPYEGQARAWLDEMTDGMHIGHWRIATVIPSLANLLRDVAGRASASDTSLRALLFEVVELRKTVAELRRASAPPEPPVCDVCGCVEDEHVWSDVDVCRGCYEGEKHRADVYEGELKELRTGSASTGLTIKEAAALGGKALRVRAAFLEKIGYADSTFLAVRNDALWLESDEGQAAMAGVPAGSKAHADWKRATSEAKCIFCIPAEPCAVHRSENPKSSSVPATPPKEGCTDPASPAIGALPRDEVTATAACKPGSGDKPGETGTNSRARARHPFERGQIVEVLRGKRAGKRFPVLDVYLAYEDGERPGVSIRDEGTELFYGLDEVSSVVGPAPNASDPRCGAFAPTDDMIPEACMFASGHDGECSFDVGIPNIASPSSCPATPRWSSPSSVTRDEIIETLCRTLDMVWQHFDPEGNQPNDCICGKSTWHRPNPQHFRSSGQALAWVQDVVRDAIVTLKSAPSESKAKGKQ